MSKTPGQKVFEGYRDFMDGIAYDGSGIPEWGSLNQKIRDGWEAGANRLMSEDVYVDLDGKRIDSPIITVPNVMLYTKMAHLLGEMEKYKLGQNPEKARFYARTYSHLEDAVAYMRTFVLTLTELESAPPLR